jgi:type IV pilus assembly protein PilC
VPSYRFRARDLEGSTHRGEVTAPDREAAEERLRDEGRFVLELEEAEETGGGGLVFGGVSRQDLILFTLQLATSLDAGIGILQSLAGVQEATSPPLARIVRDLRERVRAGASLSDALEHHEDVFGRLYINMVDAGEETGSVEEVLFEIASYLEWQEELISDLRQLAIYPAVVFLGVAALVVVLFNFVLPRLLGTVQELGVELSAPTRFLIVTSDAFSTWWPLMIVAVLAAAGGFLVARRTERGRYALDWLLLRVPVVGNVHRKVALSRFAHNLSTLYSAGVGILRSLELVEAVVGNAVIEERLRAAREQVGMGSSLTEALSGSREFPKLVLQMISVGERTGSLDQSLQKVREFYDREIPRTVDRFFSILEPALIMLMGGLIALVALGVYLPIYSVIQQIGG